MAAAGARAILLGAVELFVRARDRILPVVGDVLHALVQLIPALLAEPREAVALVVAPVPVAHQQVAVGIEGNVARPEVRVLASNQVLLEDDVAALVFR